MHKTKNVTTAQNQKCHNCTKTKMSQLHKTKNVTTATKKMSQIHKNNNITTAQNQKCQTHIFNSYPNICPNILQCISRILLFFFVIKKLCQNMQINLQCVISPKSVAGFLVQTDVVAQSEISLGSTTTDVQSWPNLHGPISQTPTIPKFWNSQNSQISRSFFFFTFSGQMWFAK